MTSKRQFVVASIGVTAFLTMPYWLLFLVVFSCDVAGIDVRKKPDNNPPMRAIVVKDEVKGR